MAAELYMKYSFDHIIVNVGANYIREQVPPSSVANDISDFLEAMSDLFACKVPFSCVLPQRGLGVFACRKFH